MFIKVIASCSALLALNSAAWGWGQIGHRTSGFVAEAYLTPKSKQILKSLLKGQNLADISTWADTLRGNDNLKHTSPYHYEGVPEGILYLDHLKGLPPDQVERGGVLQAILVAERQMEDPQVPMDQKAFALRFLVHFIGDLHQPLHSGRPEDKGGNTISVKWFGYAGSLHSVWDTGMILSGHSDIFAKRAEAGEDQTLRYAKLLLKKFGGSRQPEATRDNPEAWLMESVQARVPAYDPDYNRNQQAYQDRNLPTVDHRVYAAGVRIADVLNRIFENVPAPPSQQTLEKNIEAMIGKLENIITLGPRQNPRRGQEAWW